MLLHVLPCRRDAPILIVPGPNAKWRLCHKLDFSFLLFFHKHWYDYMIFCRRTGWMRSLIKRVKCVRSSTVSYVKRFIANIGWFLCANMHGFIFILCCQAHLENQKIQELAFIISLTENEKKHRHLLFLLQSVKLFTHIHIRFQVFYSQILGLKKNIARQSCDLRSKKKLIISKNKETPFFWIDEKKN